MPQPAAPSGARSRFKATKTLEPDLTPIARQKTAAAPPQPALEPAKPGGTTDAPGTANRAMPLTQKPILAPSRRNLNAAVFS